MSIRTIFTERVGINRLRKSSSIPSVAAESPRLGRCSFTRHEIQEPRFQVLKNRYHPWVHPWEDDEATSPPCKTVTDDAPKIVAFRKFITSGCDVPDPAAVWSVVQVDLPRLLKQVKALLSEDRPKPVKIPSRFEVG